MADAGLIAICPSAALTEGGVGVRFEVPLGGQGVPAFALRHGGAVRAFLNRCAHARMELDWNDGRFLDGEGRFLICSGHGALFDPAGGACVGGPCLGRGGLTALTVVEMNGTVYWRPGPAASP